MKSILLIVAVGAVASAGCGGSTAKKVVGSASLGGVYRMDTRYGDDSTDPTPVPENYGHWIFALERGRFAFTQEYKDACTWGYGKLVVKGDEMAWTFTNGGGIAPTGAVNKPGEHFRYHWSRYRSTLSLSAVKVAGLPENESSPTNFRAKPWHLVSTTPSKRYFSRKCPPPKEALR